VYKVPGNKIEKIYALDLSQDEWEKQLAAMGQPKFRAEQVVQWLWQKHVYDANEMTNLSKPLREELKGIFDFGLPSLIKEQRSVDGTRKFLWQFSDRQTAESVLIKHGDRLTACVSTQIGCPLQCIFCATGLTGYVRNLSSGEIAAQFLAMEKIIGRDIGNIVYMGMGEPLLNTANVLKSVRMLNDEKMRNLGIRHITISTAGIVPGIIALANSGLKVRLAISLHAVDEELRGQLMPINQKYPAAELRKAMQEYQKITGDRITIEYALFGGVNDSVEHARVLVRYLKGIHVFINLIPGNDIEGRFDKPLPENVLNFRKVLETAGFESDIRQERGADINAACGQLRLKTADGESYRLDSKSDFKLDASSNAAEQKKTAVKNQEKKHSVAGDRPERRKPFDREGKTRKTAAATRIGKTPRTDGKVYGKSAAAEPHKRRKTDEPPKERYRSGKIKEERPSYKPRNEDKTPERSAERYKKSDGDKRKADKKAPGREKVNNSMTGARRRPKASAKTRAKKR